MIEPPDETSGVFFLSTSYFTGLHGGETIGEAGFMDSTSPNGDVIAATGAQISTSSVYRPKW